MKRIYAIHNPRTAGSTVAVWFGAVVCLLLMTATVLGQKETNTRPTPAPTPPQARTESEPWPSKPNLSNPQALPPSSVVEIKSTLAELRENIALMQTINEDLQKAFTANSAPAYDSVITNAADISRLAVRLMRNLALAPKTAQAPVETPVPGASVAVLKIAIADLDLTIQQLLKDPVLTHPRTVDAGELSNAGANLETIMSRSGIVRREAELLASNSG